MEPTSFSAVALVDQPANFGKLTTIIFLRQVVVHALIGSRKSLMLQGIEWQR
jgi:hypothetical protein